jgi:putative phosphoesterase
MRLGIISDIHGDARSLRDALAQLARLEVREIVCAGDLLDWGPSPDAAIELLERLRIPCVRGNHDYVDTEGRDLAGLLLHERTISFIDRLTPTWSTVMAGVRVAMWHARPADQMRGIHAGEVAQADLLEAAKADVLIVGHTHVPMHLACPAGAIVNPGSVLREATNGHLDLPATGTFGLLELPSGRFTVHRTADGREIPLEAATP